MFMRQIKLIISIFFIFNAIIAQNTKDPLLTSNHKLQQKWVDSIYNTLSLKKKVGQLYTIQVFSNQDEATKNEKIQLDRRVI
mgnify:CR=1 FL=1